MKLGQLEIESSLIINASQSSEGVILKLENNMIIFISGFRIGIFKRSSLKDTDGDFSKIPQEFIEFHSSPSISHEGSSYVTQH